MTDTQATYRQAACALADQLAASGWTLRPRNEDGHDLHLDGPGGMAISLCRHGDCGSTTWTVYAQFKDSRPQESFTIHQNWTRKPTVLAADLRRRLLEPYAPVFAQMARQDAAREALEAAVAVTMQRIADTLPGTSIRDYNAYQDARPDLRARWCRSGGAAHTDLRLAARRRYADRYVVEIEGLNDQEVVALAVLTTEVGDGRACWT